MTDPLAQRIAIIGLGKLGGILARAFIEKGLIGKDQTAATVAHQSRADSLAEEFRFPVSTDNSGVGFRMRRLPNWSSRSGTKTGSASSMRRMSLRSRK